MTTTNYTTRLVSGEPREWPDCERDTRWIGSSSWRRSAWNGRAACCDGVRRRRPTTAPLWTHSPCCPRQTTTRRDWQSFSMTSLETFFGLPQFLPGITERKYYLWRGRHNLRLCVKNSTIMEHDFITRLIFKDVYWLLNFSPLFYIFTLES